MKQIIVQPTLMALISLTGSWATDAAWAQFALTRVVDFSEIIPGSNQPYGSIGTFATLPAVSGNHVGFLAGQQVGVGLTTTVFVEQSGAADPAIVASNQDRFPSTNDPFLNFLGFSLEGNEVAFQGNSQEMGDPNAPLFGFFTNMAGGNINSILTNVSNTPAPPPFQQELLRPTGFDVGLDNGSLAFRAGTLSGNAAGFYTNATGPITAVVDASTINPSTGAAFDGLNAGSFSFDSGLVAFTNGTPNTFEANGIYTRDVNGGTINTIADTTTLIPNTANNFASFAKQPNIRNGNVAFIGFDAASNPGIYVHDGAMITTIVDATTPVPGVPGASFTAFGFPTANPFASFRQVGFDGTSVAFTGFDSNGGSGVYTDVNGALERVIGAGDSLNGRTVASANIGRQGIDGGEMAMVVGFQGGGGGIYKTFASPLSAGGSIPTSELRAETDGAKFFRDSFPPFGIITENDPDLDVQPVLPNQVNHAEAASTFGLPVGNPSVNNPLAPRHESQARSLQDTSRFVDPQGRIPVIDFGARSEALLEIIPNSGFTLDAGPWTTAAEAVNISQLQAPPPPAGAQPGDQYTERVELFLDGKLSRFNDLRAIICNDGCPPTEIFGRLADVSASVSYQVILHRFNASGASTEQVVVFDESASLIFDTLHATSGWANSFSRAVVGPNHVEEQLVFLDTFDVDVPFGEKYAYEVVLSTGAASGAFTNLSVRFYTESDFFNTGGYTLSSLTPGVQSVFLDSNGNPVGIPEPATNMLLVASLSVVLTRRSRHRRSTSVSPTQCITRRRIIMYSNVSTWQSCDRGAKRWAMAVLACGAIAIALGDFCSSARANSVRVLRAYADPTQNHLYAEGELMAASGTQNMAEKSRAVGMTTLDAMAVRATIEDISFSGNSNNDPHSFIAGTVESTLDWEVLIEPDTGIDDTLFMQLVVDIAGTTSDLGRPETEQYMEKTWRHEVRIDGAPAPVSVSPSFSTSVQSLPSLIFEVPVGTPFDLRQSLIGEIVIDEALVPPNAETYGSLEFTAATRRLQFFDTIDGSLVQFDANLTVDGGPAPFRTPPTPTEMLEDITRRAIRGEEGAEILNDRKNNITSLSGDDLVALAFNLSVGTVANVENILEQLRSEEVRAPFRSGEIDDDERDSRDENMTRISAWFREAKNHPTFDQFRMPRGLGETQFNMFISHYWGADPFYGLYTPDAMLTLPPPDPSMFTFSSGPDAAGVTLVLPEVWGGGLRSPEVLNSQVTVRFAAGGVELVNLTTDIASYEILGGQQTGVNHGFYPEGGQVWSDVDLLTGEFTAHGEGLITNDLYPAERPIFVFQDIQGQVLNVDGETLVDVFADNEPMIVPGRPGEDPAPQPIAYAATRARYDAATRRVHFVENTDASLAPNVSVVLTPEDVFGVSLDNSAEPLIGAEVHIDPLLLRSVQSQDEDVFFFDTAFEIRNDDGIFASGTFSLVRIDVTVMALIANVEFDDVANPLASPFIEDWQSDPDRVMLLGRIGTLDLMADTEFFTQSGFSPTDFIAFTRRVQGIPEPTTLSLLLAIAVAAPAFRAATPPPRSRSR